MAKERSWRGVAVLIAKTDALCMPPVYMGGFEPANTMAIFRNSKAARKWCGSSDTYKTVPVLITVKTTDASVARDAKRAVATVGAQRKKHTRKST